MGNKSILTIAIPTYNRVEQIQKQVRLLLPQLTADVCLVVLDNHSDIPVENYFSMEELSHFTIVRHNANKGILGNWLACFDCCNTKWLWTISDDDQFIEDIVSLVLSQITLHNDSVFINIGTERSVTTVGFEQYCLELRNLTSYTDSFWMTKCIFNFELLSSFQFYNYFYATSMISPVIMVLKYLECHSEGKVRLEKVNIITGFELVNTWLKSDFMKLGIITCDIFDLNLHPVLRKTLFYSQFKLNYLIMNELVACDKIKVGEIRYCLRLMAARFGYWRMSSVFFVDNVTLYLKILLPSRIIDFLRLVKNVTK